MSTIAINFEKVIMNKYLSVLLITVIILVGCRPQTAKNSSAPTQSPITTRTVEPETTMTMASQLPMAVVSPDLESNCVSILSTPPTNIKIEGTAVFLDRAQIIVPVEVDKFRIPNEFPGDNKTLDQSVSPNNKLLMYQQIKNGDLGEDVVITSNGTVINKFVKEFAGSLPGGYWISNEYIRYLIRSETDNQLLTLVALNIRTGEYLKLRTDFPDMADGDQLNWGIDNGAVYDRSDKGTEVIYDPSLSRVAYPKQGSYVSVYDIQKDVELATIKLADGGYDPMWSPDGQYFSIKGSDPKTLAQDIYFISRDGSQFTPLTYLTKLYPKVSFGSYSWSPDSQRIAFWVNKEGYGFDDSLFLLDLATMKMTDVCIKGLGSFGSILGAEMASNYKWDKKFIFAGKPIFSPDGKKIMITRFDADRRQAIDILIDLENKIAYPIGTDLEPMGWMSNDP